MTSIRIIKIGGNVVDDPTALATFLDSFAALEGRKLLIHGGGKIASAFGRRLGIEPVMIDGRRVTNAETIELVTMIYGGLVNKQLVAALQSRGCNAFGLTGADGGVVRSKRRNPVPVDYGFVGDPVAADAALLERLIEAGAVPVVAPLTMGEQYEILNTNADTMAQTVATALADRYAVDLVYTFELEGVLDQNKQLIPTVNRARFEALKADGTVSGGMLPKLENALRAVEAGVRSVAIGATIIST